jgi:hypothetical protein
MRNFIYITICIVLVSVLNVVGQSGGQSGATQLLINPWSNSSSVGGSSAAYGKGMEAAYMNPAGTSGTKKTELIFSRTNWLQGTQIYINAFGISQRLNKKSVLSLGVMSFNLGDIDITTVANPDGGIGTYKPQFINGSLTYAREFSNKINGGISLKIISESIHNVNALGIALDAGVQYIAGKNDHISFGVAMKNAGPNMSYSGDGLKVQLQFPNGQTQSGDVSAASFSLPLLMNLGAGYRFYFGRSHKLQTGYTYSARMNLNDQSRVGLDYQYKTYLNIKIGFVYEDGILDAAARNTAMTGPTGGFSFQLPYGKNGAQFGFNYSYRDTNPFEGIHTFGARIIL